MKNIAHIVYSDAPLPERVNHLAVCGKIVHNAVQGFVWNEQIMMAPLDLRTNGLCQDCYLALPPSGKLFVYAFKEGEKNAE